MSPNLSAQQIAYRIDGVYAKHGIQALGNTSNGFRRAVTVAVNSQEISNEMSAALPFSLVVKNISKRPLALIGLRLELESQDGKSVPQIYLTHSLNSGNGLQGGAEPGGPGRLVSAFSAANAMAQASWASRRMPPELLQSLPERLRQELNANGSFLEKQRLVTVALDSVIFVDGGLIGPDRNGSERFIKARLDGEQDIVKGVIGRAEMGHSQSEILSYLRTMVGRPVRGDHQTGTWDHYTDTQNAVASQLADRLERNGFNLSEIRQMVAVTGPGHKISTVRREE